MLVLGGHLLQKRVESFALLVLYTCFSQRWYATKCLIVEPAESEILGSCIACHVHKADNASVYSFVAH